jgi:flagellar motor component MotA
MDNISVHGESAIGLSQMGRRQKDTHVRVGMTLGAVLCVLSVIFAVTRPGGGAGVLLIVLPTLSIGVAVLVAAFIGRRNRQKWEAEDRLIREARAAEKARQLEDFLETRGQ